VVGKIPDFTYKCFQEMSLPSHCAVSCSETNSRHFLCQAPPSSKLAEDVRVQGGSPFAEEFTMLKELDLCVKICLPELIIVMFYTAHPYLQLQRERAETPLQLFQHFQRSLSSGLSLWTSSWVPSYVYKLC